MTDSFKCVQVLAVIARDNLITRQRIVIAGRVQGVGCRPFVWRAAVLFGLTGEVYNDANGVVIEVQGNGETIDKFVDCVRAGCENIKLPPLMEVSSCNISEIALVEGETGFVIARSDSGGMVASQVTPDIATCQDCLSEMKDTGDFRYRYPFINCTNCGPRYSIVKTIPYDRCNTTMGSFAMCDNCRKQYEDVSDRRFHAQPVACAECGPAVWLTDNDGVTIEDNCEQAIAGAARMLREGKTVAVKGIGGFHLAVDAFNDEAVKRLRQRKRRDHKPFAMMAVSVEAIQRYAVVDAKAESLLKSPHSPIVLLDKKAGSEIAPSVAEGTGTLGFMLCYSPLHYLLFAQEGIEVLVMTSANLSDEPLICDNDEAAKRLSGVADAFLHHNRDVYRQVDDSVLQIVDGAAAFLRRSRGYVPGPVLMDEICADDIFAAGSDLKNTFCFVKGSQLILSEHIGDLEDGLVYRHYIESVKHLSQLFKVEPSVVACDLHPGYLSSGYARSLGVERLITVQHHWAHVASVLAEHNYKGKVIGIVADGTGYGTDGAVWGFECLVADLEGYERIGHLSYFPLAGGDKAGKEAIRPLMGLLKVVAGDDSYIDTYHELLGGIEADRSKVEVIAQQIARNINTVRTSSLGRVFDAVSALAGLGIYNNFEAQLPIRLESVIDSVVTDSYRFEIAGNSGGTFLFDFRSMLNEIIGDVLNGTEAGIISAKFHNCLADVMVEFAIKGRQISGLDTVALSGGVFCNRYLANRTIRLLKENNFCVLFNRSAPVNDGGISLGQAAIAARAVSRGKI